jgi:hypothetical protein
MTLGLGTSEIGRFLDIPCTGRTTWLPIGSTVKERELTLWVRFSAYPESARRRPEKVGFPTN